MEGMHETDRIVIVASGFGLWLDGRHVASARWGDVSRVRASRPGGLVTTPLLVEVTLADGTTIAMPEHVSGWFNFLQTAATRLPGLPRVEVWRPPLSTPGASAADELLFDRQARRR